VYSKVIERFEQLPPEYSESMLDSLRAEFLRSGKTIVVLDDDPTGTQTCYDVTVLISWEVGLITEELKKRPSILFILTNSRSLNEHDAVLLTKEIGQNLSVSAKESGRGIIVVSRSDSTLRGHFPAEVDAIAAALDLNDAVKILVPAFIEGGRFTIDDVHYIVEQQELVPVSDTPFAKDVVFGYTHADLKQWVEEKTKGKVMASDVISLSLTDIRVGGPAVVSEKFRRCPAGSICIVNAASYRDLEVLVMGLMLAEASGKRFLFRTSATFVPIRAGLVSGKTFVPGMHDVASPNGSLLVVGSHVPKTSRQLSWLLSHGEFKPIEVDVSAVLHAREPSLLVSEIVQDANQWLAEGNDVVIHTSRKLEVGSDSEGSLKINALVSDFLVSIMKGIMIRPKFILAKGGITSSDLASRGLGAKKAMILGAVIPGVPVWQMDSGSKFPGIMYVVFPGNVGEDDAMLAVFRKFNG